MGILHGQQDISFSLYKVPSSLTGCAYISDATPGSFRILDAQSWDAHLVQGVHAGSDQ